jgi:2-dehydro-3-deoxyglucarate aldolase/4-hydroxy-2-oxoheptanedioate aldolase
MSPRAGARGVGLGRAHGYGLNAAEYIQHANEACAVIVQIEHIRAVENVEEIISVPGVDGVFVGPWDLSASLGKPGQVEDAEVLAAIDRVRAACQQRGMPLSVFANGVESARRYIAQGFTLIANGMDIWLMAEAAQNMVRGIRKKTNSRLLC